MNAFVSAVILAAGLGRRMGRQKLLLRLGKNTVIERVADAALASKVNEVVVVLGYQADHVAEVLGERPVRLVTNPVYSLGQSTSLIAGAKAVDPGVGAVMIILGDQPLLSPALINRLVDFYNSSNFPIVRPVSIKGNPCHPVIFDKRLVPELLNLKGDTGAREVVSRYSRQLGLVPVGDEVELLDADTIAEYIRLKSIVRNEKRK